jgi:sulfur relay (sulfurtransferase) DsrF/TusC family protein
MATVASPFGFQLRRHPTGQSRANAYTILASYATAIGEHDFVSLATDGTIQLTAAGANDTFGQFAGVTYTDATGKPTTSNFWPGAVTGATNIVCWVYDDPDNVFEVQVATGGTGYVQASIGDQADLVAGTVNTATGRGTQALNAALKGAAGQGQFRIVGFGSDGVYDATANTFPTVLVQQARHQFMALKVAI